MEDKNQHNASPYVIEMCRITKRFPGIVANDSVNLHLKRGEIHALLSENGAGKSTLMSVPFGLYQPDEGEILKDGKPVTISAPNVANILGSLMFGFLKCLSVIYSSLDVNGDGAYALAELELPMYFYNIISYASVLIVLAFSAGKSRAPKAEGIPYDKGQRYKEHFHENV